MAHASASAPTCVLAKPPPVCENSRTGAAYRPYKPGQSSVQPQTTDAYDGENDDHEDEVTRPTRAVTIASVVVRNCRQYSNIGSSVADSFSESRFTFHVLRPWESPCP
jgi:hypothetical protein